MKDRLNKEFGIKNTLIYYWLTCLLKLISIDSLNEYSMNMAEAHIKESGMGKLSVQQTKLAAIKAHYT